MQLSKELKNKLNNAKTKEEVDMILAETKKSAEKAGLILDQEDLNQASGGFPNSQTGPIITPMP